MSRIIHPTSVAPSRLARLLVWLHLDKLLPWLKEDRTRAKKTARKAGRELLESEAQYRQILNSNTSIAYLIDTDTACIVHANAAAAAFWGYPLLKLCGMSITDINIAPRAQLFKDLHRSQDGIPLRLEWRHRLKNGEIRDVEVYRRPLTYRGKTLLYCIVHDISAHKRAEEELRLAVTVFNTMDEAVMVTGPDQHIIKVNRAFTVITGYSPDEVIGKNQDLLSSGMQSPVFYEKQWETLTTTGSWQGEVRNRRKSGEVYVGWLFIKQVLDQQGMLTHHVAVFSDISERKATEDNMRHSAHYDALTDLPNRTLFTDRLRQALTQAKRDKAQMAMMFIDLDQFKPVNDTHGHDVGDLLLKRVAERMLNCLRASDTAARIGGDEFVVLLPTIEDVRDAMMIAEKILQALSQPFELTGHSLNISASIGVAVYPEHGSDEKLLLRNADIAMYHAKKIGRNNVKLYQSEMLASSV